LTGQTDAGPRNEFFYFSDDGKLVGLRSGDWKLVFAEQRARQFQVWREPFVELRIPKLFHLRRDPYERADTDSNHYQDWAMRKITLTSRPAIGEVQQFLMTFIEFPPRQRPASFTVDQIVEKFMAW
jgi:hypothetical protein